jgi:DNA-binding winged helix-turn-helix (wHTH) protein/TolB-like protein/Tfp pilus assembly protein PilF
MSKQTKQLYEFGGFRLDAAERRLLHNGEPVQVTPKAFDTLIALVENSGCVVEKETLLQKVWPDTIVEEATLAQNISTLRKALGEGNSEFQYIETVPKHGYRFVAVVKNLAASNDTFILEKQKTARIVIEEEEAPGSVLMLKAATNGLPEQPTDDLPVQAVAQSKRYFGLRPFSGWLVALLLVASVVVATVAFRGGDKANSIETSLETGRSVKFIAVLPFQTINSDGRDEILELGMADALIIKLSNLKQIVVRPTSSIRKYAGIDQDPLAIGKELKVDAVLSANTQRVGDKVRVTVQLVNVKDGSPLWAYKCDYQGTDIFTVQDSISEQIAAALALQLTSEEKRHLTKRYTESTEAYQLYAKGRFFWDKRTESSLKKSIECFEQAIKIDENYALAYAGLADAYAILNFYSALQMKDAYPKARAAAEKALSLDNSLAEAHTVLAYVKEQYDWDWAGAEVEFKRAIALNPNYATAHQYYSEYLAFVGRTEESIRHITRAQELDPNSLVINTELGFPYLCARQYDSALEKFRQALERDANFAFALYQSARCYDQKSMFDEAIAEYRKAIALSGGSSVMTARLGYTYALAGRKAEAKAALEELFAASKQRHISPYLIATIYTGLGDNDKAMQWLEKAYEVRDGMLVMLKVDAHLDGLRSDARFQDLLRRVGLA